MNLHLAKNLAECKLFNLGAWPNFHAKLSY